MNSRQDDNHVHIQSKCNNCVKIVCQANRLYCYNCYKTTCLICHERWCISYYQCQRCMIYTYCDDCSQNTNILHDDDWCIKCKPVALWF